MKTDKMLWQSDTETLEAVNDMTANSITAARILFSFAMLALSPHSCAFAAFYLLCGVSMRCRNEKHNLAKATSM